MIFYCISKQGGYDYEKIKISKSCLMVVLGAGFLFSGADLFAQQSGDSLWPMFHHDGYHTGLSPLTGNMDSCFLSWSYLTGGDVESSPALGDIDGDGKLEIVVGSNDDKLYALNGELTGIEKPTSIVPEVIFVLQNQPNPFTVTTEIRYGLPENLNVNITVYNLLGEKIVTLVDENKKAGYYTTIWDGRDNTGRNLSSGVYFIKFNAGGYSRTLKAILME
ncbi:hypothetical protein DRQ17_07545 [bacterium]|nr:MAG: hypothetical protein DRQ17_07545 [bacterium]RKZ24318.1 MAG: hypothetical protein DRQ23_00670 [bacterium]